MFNYIDNFIIFIFVPILLNIFVIKYKNFITCVTK